MFQGHQLVSLLNDLLLALLPMVIVIVLNRLLIYRQLFFSTITGLFYLAILPNATYAFLEIKHLVLLDGIADKLSFSSLVVFGGISIVGLISTVWCTVHTAKLFRNKVARMSYLVLISGLQAIGASLGQLDIYSRDLVLNPAKVLNGITTLANSIPWLVFIGLLTTCVLLVSITILLYTKLLTNSKSSCS